MRKLKLLVLGVVCFGAGSVAAHESSIWHQDLGTVYRFEIWDYVKQHPMFADDQDLYREWVRIKCIPAPEGPEYGCAGLDFFYVPLGGSDEEEE